MRLYICADGSYAGTQEDAKAKGKHFTLAEVPTDKAGILDYLNGLVAAEGPDNGPPAPAAPSPAMTQPKPRPPAPTPDSGAEAIGDWIYHHATSAEVHDVFMCLAARFSGARR